jgi:Domain of Unknown Function (DUF1080)
MARASQRVAPDRCALGAAPTKPRLSASDGTTKSLPDHGGGRQRRGLLIAGATVVLVGLVLGGWVITRNKDGKDSSGNGHAGKISGANRVEVNGPPTRPVIPSPAVSGQHSVVDLLPLVDLTKDTVAGNWASSAEGLTSDKDGIAVLEFPYRPPSEYDFRVDFTCRAGWGEVNQFLARGDRSFSYVMGANGGRFFGLEMIGGKDCGENGTVLPRRLSLNERHRCVVHVRNDVVVIEVDGQELTRWKTDYSDLGLDHPKWKHWVRRDPSLLAFASNRTPTTVHKAEVIEITGQGTRTRPGSTAANSNGAASVPLFNGRDLAGWQVLGHPGWTVKDAVLVGETAGPVGWLMSEKEYADFELNLEYRQSAGGNSGIFLRAWPEGPIGGNQFMEIQLIDDRKTGDPKTRTGAIFEVLAPDPPARATVDQWHRIDIHLLGRQLHVTFDDQKIISTNLDNHKDRFARFPGLNKAAGRIGLQLYPGKIEFRNIRVRKLAKP